MQTTTRIVALRLLGVQAAAALTALGALGLAGCGGGGSGGSGGVKSDPTPTPTPTPTPAATAATPTPAPAPTATPSPTPTSVPAPTATVEVAPVAVTVSVGDTRAFAASIRGDDSLGQAVTWSVREGSGGGTITTDGLYSAPMVPGTYHVTATSVADSAQTGSATVLVQAGGAAGSIQ